MKTILVVEDDEEILRLLLFNLERQGYRVLSAGDGPKGLQLAREHRPDLILLDIMLPGVDGLEVCRSLRADAELARIPVIMLTAKSEEVDIVLGLELGADDYVTKPFSIRELLARIKVHLRRGGQEPAASGEESEEESLVAGEIELRPQQYEVYVREKPVSLTLKEFELLRLLMANAGRVLKRDFLLERLWGYESAVDTRTVDVHVRYLRQKIERDPANPRYIETVRGVGYRFKIPGS